MYRKVVIVLMLACLADVALAQVNGGNTGTSRFFCGLTDDGFVTFNATSDMSVDGIDLKSASGSLVPIPPGNTTADASPFTFLLANTNLNVSYNAIPGTNVTIPAGTLVTQVGYSGQPEGFRHDLAASTYGSAGFSQVAFPCAADSSSDITPRTPWVPVERGVPLAPMTPTNMYPEASVIGGLTSNGYVTLTARQDTPMSGLDLKSSSGNFVPIPPGDTAAPAGPFTFLLANTSSNVSYAAIPGTTVTLRQGTLVTEVGYRGELEAFAEDLSGTYGARFFASGSTIPFVGYSSSDPITAHGDPVTPVLGLVSADKEIQIYFAQETGLQSFDLTSAAGNLIPIPPGDTTASATPFDLLLANSTTQVSFTPTPGTVTTLPAGVWSTGVGYDGDLSTLQSDLGVMFSDSVGFVAIPVAAEFVPEPGGSMLSVLAALMLLPFRPRKRKLATEEGP